MTENADDTTLLCLNSNSQAATFILQSNCKNVVFNFNSNKVMLNVKKTNCVHISGTNVNSSFEIYLILTIDGPCVEQFLYSKSSVFFLEQAHFEKKILQKSN